MAKLVFFTQNTMASVVATRKVLLKHHDQISAIVLSSQLKGEAFTDQLKVAYKLIKKSSLGFFSYKLVESKLYNLLLTSHKLLKTKLYQTGQAKTIRGLAKQYQIPIIETTDLSDPEFLQKVKKLNPDYILCLVSQILKKNVFETLGNKLINAHGSYLPEYRGAAQYFWYLLNQDPQYGVTIHFMEPGLDTGDIIFQRKFYYDSKTSVYKLHYDLAASFGDMLNEFIEEYTNKQFSSIKQDHQKATFTRMPLKEDLIQLKSRGVKLLPVRDFLRNV